MADRDWEDKFREQMTQVHDIIRETAEKFVETIKTGDQEIFEPYIYKDSQMDDFMDKVLGRFEGSSL
ncbi:MAG: hypothetical protein IKP66_07975, partial [Lachnospiraceae bacterium]|nr:hypothetical protein [Lachnospiraceae bacterium]